MQQERHEQTPCPPNQTTSVLTPVSWWGVPWDNRRGTPDPGIIRHRKTNFPHIQKQNKGKYAAENLAWTARKRRKIGNWIDGGYNVNRFVLILL
jgi:hypothetical protein